jgi:DNA gyrase subunit A
MGDGDRAISMTILEACRRRRLPSAAYLKRSVPNAASPVDGEEEEEVALTNEECRRGPSFPMSATSFLKQHEQFVLTVTEYGYGKRSSSYDFRLTGRGGKGIRATDVSKVAEIGRSWWRPSRSANEDQIMLVSDGGQVIRVPVNGIRIASRATKGVTIFNTAEGEKVVSVERISEPERRGEMPTS